MRLYSSAVDKFEKVLAVKADNVEVLVICGLALKDMALCMSLDDPDTIINLEVHTPFCSLLLLMEPAMTLKGEDFSLHFLLFKTKFHKAMPLCYHKSPSRSIPSKLGQACGIGNLPNDSHCCIYNNAALFQTSMMQPCDVVHDMWPTNIRPNSLECVLQDSEACMEQALGFDAENEAAKAGLAECQDRLRVCREYATQKA